MLKCLTRMPIALTWLMLTITSPPAWLHADSSGSIAKKARSAARLLDGSELGEITFESSNERSKACSWKTVLGAQAFEQTTSLHMCQNLAVRHQHCSIFIIGRACMQMAAAV